MIFFKQSECLHCNIPILKRIALLAVGVLFTLVALGQPPTSLLLKGVVRDLKSKKEISGIKISSDSNPEEVISDRRGNFCLTVKATDRVFFKKEGYQSLNLTVDECNAEVFVFPQVFESKHHTGENITCKIDTVWLDKKWYRLKDLNNVKLNNSEITGVELRELTEDHFVVRFTTQ